MRKNCQPYEVGLRYYQSLKSKKYGKCECKPLNPEKGCDQYKPSAGTVYSLPYLDFIPPSVQCFAQMFVNFNRTIDLDSFELPKGNTHCEEFIDFL